MRVLPILMLVVAGCSSSTTLPGVVGGASAAAHKGLVVKVATVTKPPIHVQKGTTGAFAVEAKEESTAVRNVVVQVDVAKLPIDGTLCQNEPLNRPMLERAGPVP